MNDALGQRLKGISDEDLLDMVNKNPEDYTPDAIRKAKEEVERRGGAEKLYAIIDAKYQSIREEEDRTRAEQDGLLKELKFNARKRISIGVLWLLGLAVVIAVMYNSLESGVSISGRGLGPLSFLCGVYGLISITRGIISLAEWFRLSAKSSKPASRSGSEAERPRNPTLGEP